MNDVSTLDTTTKDIKPIVVVDEAGCDFQCTTMSSYDTQHEMIVARNEAIYYFGLDYSTCSIIDGTKLSVSIFRQYLIVVSKNETNAGDHAALVSIFDLKNKFIAYHGSFPSVAHVIDEWNEIFIITEDKAVGARNVSPTPLH